MLRKMALLLLVLVAIGGCSVQTVGTPSPATAPGEPTTAAGAPATAPSRSTTVAGDPTTASDEGTTGVAIVSPPPFAAEYKPGDTIVVQNVGSDWAKITISDVGTAASYSGANGDDTPQTAGDVFISARVTYVALTDSVSYGAAQWSVFCAGTSISNTQPVGDRAYPLALETRIMETGESASGFVVYEVPAKGEIAMYFDVLFRVVIRAA
jgi:hypothetical protein